MSADERDQKAGCQSISGSAPELNQECLSCLGQREE